MGWKIPLTIKTAFFVQIWVQILACLFSRFSVNFFLKLYSVLMHIIGVIWFLEKFSVEYS